VDPRGGALPLGVWAEKWAAARLVRPTTAANDRGRYVHHLEPVFGAVPLRDISPLRVRSYIAGHSMRTALLAANTTPGSARRTEEAHQPR
jgi:hypothetical protein